MDRTVVSYCGSGLNPYYRLDRVLSSIGSLPDDMKKRLFLVFYLYKGIGNVRKMKEELGISDDLVAVRGPVSRDVLAEVMAACDVGLVPFDNDPSLLCARSAKLHEYLSAGLYVIACGPKGGELDQLFSLNPQLGTFCLPARENLVSALEPSSTLNVIWKADDLHPNVGWKEVSFKSGWQRHPSYPGTIRPNITTDGNILDLSWNFTSGQYQYHYYVKPCNVSTDDYQHISVRWKSTGPVAVVAALFEEGSLEVVPLSSQSLEWTTTSKQLPLGRNITMILVGLTNAKNMEIDGIYLLQVDHILISG